MRKQDKKDETVAQTAEGTQEEQPKTPVLETVKVTGPCGEDNPCGGGFGTD